MNIKVTDKINIDKILELTLKGSYGAAKQHIKHKRRSKPEAIARVLGQVVGALCESGDNDAAAELINEFSK